MRSTPHWIDGLAIVAVGPRGASPFAAWPGLVAQVEVDEDGARRRLWSTQIDRAVARPDRAVLLVAHGVGCLAATCWARLSPRDYVAPVARALLVDPPSPAPAHAGFAAPASALPFASTVIAAPRPLDSALAEMVAAWGSSVMRLSPRHRSRSAILSGLDRLTGAVVERDVARGMRLLGVGEG